MPHPRAVTPSPPTWDLPSLSGCDPAAAPRLDWRLPRGEQPADQLGSMRERLPLGRFYGVAGELGLYILQHPRQGYRERNEGSVQIGGGHFGVSHAVACQAIASGRLASGVDNAA
jgi:hypothetical protein